MRLPIQFVKEDSLAVASTSRSPSRIYAHFNWFSLSSSNQIKKPSSLRITIRSPVFQLVRHHASESISPFNKTWTNPDYFFPISTHPQQETRLKMRFLLCLTVLIACWAYQPVDGQLSFLNCPAKIASALLGECQKRLQERLDLVNTAEQEIDASAPSMFRCCYFQEFIHCVSNCYPHTVDCRAIIHL